MHRGRRRRWRRGRRRRRQQRLLELRHIDSLREIQGQEDEHGNHDAVSEDGNNKIHPGARFLQVKIPHHALGECVPTLFPGCQTFLPASVPVPLPPELPRSSTTSPSSSLYISAPFLRRAGSKHTAPGCDARCRWPAGRIGVRGTLESGRWEKNFVSRMKKFFSTGGLGSLRDALVPGRTSRPFLVGPARGAGS